MSSPLSRKKHRWPWIVLALLMLLAVLVLSRSPSPARRPPPTAADAEAAKLIYYKLRWAGEQPQPKPIWFSWGHLQSGATFAGRALHVPNATLSNDGDRLALSGSLDAPLGFWVNLTLFAEPQAKAPPRLSGRAGALPLPPLVMEGLIGVARWVLDWRGTPVPAPDAVLTGLELKPGGVMATLDLPPDAAGMLAMARGARELVDPALVTREFCRLMAARKGLPNARLATLLPVAFAKQDGNASPTLVALAMVAVGPGAGRMAGDPEKIAGNCAVPGPQLTLAGRADLAKHWALSAALAATYGENVSAVLGTWKEVADSGKGGSGFSYADLAADRAGILVALRLADPAQAAATRRWLAQAKDADLLPMADLALAEGMSAEEFARRFVNTESKEHGRVVARIDAALARAMR